MLSGCVESDESQTARLACDLVAHEVAELVAAVSDAGDAFADDSYPAAAAKIDDRKGALEQAAAKTEHKQVKDAVETLLTDATALLERLGAVDADRAWRDDIEIAGTASDGVRHLVEGIAADVERINSLCSGAQ